MEREKSENERNKKGLLARPGLPFSAQDKRGPRLKKDSKSRFSFFFLFVRESGCFRRDDDDGESRPQV